MWLGCYYYISSPTVEVDRITKVREFHFFRQLDDPLGGDVGRRCERAPRFLLLAHSRARLLLHCKTHGINFVVSAGNMRPVMRVMIFFFQPI